MKRTATVIGAVLALAAAAAYVAARPADREEIRKLLYDFEVASYCGLVTDDVGEGFRSKLTALVERDRVGREEITPCADAPGRMPTKNGRTVASAGSGPGAAEMRAARRNVWRPRGRSADTRLGLRTARHRGKERIRHFVLSPGKISLLKKSTGTGTAMSASVPARWTR